MAAIYFYLKFCEREQYARDFVEGRLWMNPLEYFKKLENADASDGRRDPYEAADAWYQPSQLGSVTYGDIEIPATDLAGPVVVQAAHLDTINLLSLYAGTSGKFDKISVDTFQAFKAHMQVPERCLTMGSFAVFVHHVRDFTCRIIKTVRRENFALEAGPVTYFDSTRFSGTLEKPAFSKRDDFAWQREHRFALDRNVSSPEPYVLDVGSLADICTIVDPVEFNKTIRFGPPGFH
jgi:hypothetical protein